MKPCWKGYEQVGTKRKNGKEVPNCVPIKEMTITTPRLVKKLVEYLSKWKPVLTEAEYQGRSVKLGKPVRGDVKKYKVYVKNPKTGKVVKVNFGDPNMEIKRDDPARRKSFRARMKCDTNPGPRWKANYWSCKMWESKKSVTDYTSKGGVDDVVHQWDGITLWEESDLLKLAPHLAKAEEITEEIETESEDVNEEAAEMAMAQLAYISDYSKDLLEKLRANPKMSEEIEPWVQSKITLMEDYLFAIYNYLVYSQKGEDNKNVIEAGMRILNINASCKHYNSEGIVKEIKDLPDDMGKIIAYEVINDGQTFKKGDILTKTIDQIKILEGNK